MGVLAVVGAGQIGLGEGEGEIIGGVGWRGDAKQVGGIGTGRDDGPGISLRSTK